jgi:hypothetical protein
MRDFPVGRWRRPHTSVSVRKAMCSLLPTMIGVWCSGPSYLTCPLVKNLPKIRRRHQPINRALVSRTPHNLASNRIERISFDNVVSYFRLNLPAHDGTLMCISAHSRLENAKNRPVAILLCSVYANYRTPAGYTQWSCDVKSPMASYSSSGEIFGSFPIEALRIAFRRANQVNLREVS